MFECMNIALHGSTGLAQELDCFFALKYWSFSFLAAMFLFLVYFGHPKRDQKARFRRRM